MEGGATRGPPQAPYRHHDNLRFLQHQGDCKSRELCQLAIRVFQTSHAIGTLRSVCHFPAHLTVVAVGLAKHLLASGWILHPEVFQLP